MDTHLWRRIVGTALTVAAAAAFPIVPLTGQEHAGDHGHSSATVELFAQDIATMGDKFVELAGAMPAEQYAWRPMEGVRSVAQVFMLIAAEYYAIPAMWGAEGPEGIDAGPQLFGTFAEITDKDQVLDHLEKSLAYYQDAVGQLTDDDLSRTIQFFGRERSLTEVFVVMNGDMHEHLGQAIAYARTNHVVPPWTARAQQN